MRNVGGNADFETVNCETTLSQVGSSAGAPVRADGVIFQTSTFSPPSTPHSDTGVQNTLKPNLFFSAAADVSEFKPLIFRILK